jgi:glucokinase
MGTTEQQVIGIDLGGTAIKLGRFAGNGTCLQELTVPTPQPSTPDAVVKAIAQAVSQVDPNHDAVAIGLGTPGPADATGRIARVAINLAGWQDVPIADWLETQTGLPTVVANDANCAGLGEVWLGAGRRLQDVLVLTLGTGVGGAVILNGELFVGRQGTAGELGLITLDPNGPACNSGNRGSLEQHCSVQAVLRDTGLTPVELSTQAQSGDKTAIDYWHTYGRRLGAGLASLVYIFTPEAIILGGGISAAADFFLPTTLAELQTRVLPSSLDEMQLLIAELGNRAGMVGAARLALSRSEDMLRLQEKEG